VAYRDMTKTVFGDIQVPPVEVYRIQTESSTYFLSLHEERGRRYVLVRGAAGGDREHVVVRDSDPRIGDRSLYELAYTEWVGHPLDVATMRTSPITAVTRVVTPADIAQASVRVDPPAGMSPNPRIVPMPSRGTNIGDQAAHAPAPPFAQAPPRELARQVVVPDHPAALPYPQRHVRYAEDVATLLRSIHRRTNLFSDVSADRALRERLNNALDAAEKLLADIKKRG
jgi:hypothetical protein